MNQAPSVEDQINRPSAMNRVLLVEDNSRLSEMVCLALEQAGIGTDVFESIEAAWQALRAAPYAAVVVDRGLPDGDGLNLVRRIRGANMPIPCMMLTARDALRDRLDGLDSGADDYLAKPFPMLEMVARVRALMRRAPQLQSLAPTFADIEVWPDRGHLICGSQSITLSPAELQVLICLVKAAGKTVRRAALEAAAWGANEDVTPNALDVVVHRLRRKLTAVHSCLELVNTRGYGYALDEASTPS